MNRKVNKDNHFAQGHPIRNGRDNIKALAVYLKPYAKELALRIWKLHHHPGFQPISIHMRKRIEEHRLWTQIGVHIGTLSFIGQAICEKSVCCVEF